MGKLVASKDWSKTPLGPIETWPHSLRTTVSLCLASNFPISLAWGPEHTQIYNDGYWPICGAKHPHSMGQGFKECWETTWPAIGESFEKALEGKTSYLENQRMFLDRNGFLEEAFFTFSFSPIKDESGGVGGLFHPVTEQTDRMLSERRTRALRDLADHTGNAKNIDEVFKVAVTTLSAYEFDLPFILFYKIDYERNVASLSSHYGVNTTEHLIAETIDITKESIWKIEDVISTGLSVQINGLQSVFKNIQCGPYEEAPDRALVMPIVVAGNKRVMSVVIAGVSSRLPMNESYRSFYNFLNASIKTAVVNAQAFEEERKRTEALAEIDRAKTMFFSNVSHEFRTPLTLMLGPLEDLLNGNQTTTIADQHERLDLAYRNALRLQKLVNSLLDFSRIEAKRIQASFRPTALAEFTTEIASMFESAFLKAGLTLRVKCSPLSEPIYIDQDMWEKIVLNLLSNSLKHTFDGEVEISLRMKNASVELKVRDTGIGVPEDQLPKLFERFHQVPNARSRTHEGSGIGLSLVHELVKLHGGQISVESKVDVGTTFTISIPTGSEHLPQDRINSTVTLSPTTIGAKPFVYEALRWLPKEDSETLEQLSSVPSTAISDEKTTNWRGVMHSGNAKIILADDNADMRDYIHKILSPFCDVVAVANGSLVLAEARLNPPDLILTDVMMPNMDGFELLSAIRSDELLKAIPVILISARAGEDARVEGLQAGANDYVVKPFNAKELLARIKANLDQASVSFIERSKAIIESEERFRTLADQIPVTVFLASPDAKVTYWNKHWIEFTGQSFPESLGSSWADVLHPADVNLTRKIFIKAAERKMNYTLSARVRRADGTYRHFLFNGGPRFLSNGKFVGFAGTGIDVHEQKLAEENLENLVLERTIQLERSNLDLQQFAHVASHDLKEPVRKIKTFSYRLQDELNGILTETAKTYLTKIQSASDRMNDMIEGVLSYSKMNASEQGTDWIDLNTVIDSISTDLEVLIQQKSAILNTSKLPRLEGATVLIYQLFYNLINNSLKFSKQGVACEINITANVDRNDEGVEFAEIIVTDNGIGFDQEFAEKIFETFIRLNSKDKFEGTGLGLALCKKIVQRHGGSISAFGTKNEGARFVIQLPVKQR